MRKYKVSSITTIVGIVLILFSMFALLQEKIIFLPTRLPQDFVYSFEREFEEFYLESGDRTKLNALHFCSNASKGLILYFHGNAGNLSRWGQITSRLVDFGYDVIVMDYRGYGKSGGKICEEVLYSDAQLFYDHALKKYGAGQIVVYGRSLGTSIATWVASRNNTKKLILETPFYNLKDVAKERFPFLPVSQLLRYKMASNEFIKGVEVPIRIFHGTSDRVVAYSSGKKLFDAIPFPDKKFYTIDQGRHNNLDQYEVYWRGLDFELD